MYDTIFHICNPDYQVIQNALLITRVVQPLSDILGVEPPTFDVLSNMYETVNAACGSCNSRDGCDPYCLIKLFRDYAAAERKASRRPPLDLMGPDGGHVAPPGARSVGRCCAECGHPCNYQSYCGACGSDVLIGVPSFRPLAAVRSHEALR